MATKKKQMRNQARRKRSRSGERKKGTAEKKTEVESNESLEHVSTSTRSDEETPKSKESLEESSGSTKTNKEEEILEKVTAASKENPKKSLEDSSRKSTKEEESLERVTPASKEAPKKSLEESSRKSTKEEESLGKELITTASKETPKAAGFESIKPPLSECVLNHLTSLGFSQPTPVQSATIPLFLTNKDVSVQAVTGSGKTLAFLIPMVEMILRLSVPLGKNEVGGIVISPTRELAKQTHGVCKSLCASCGLPEPLLLVGGRSVPDDLRNFLRMGSDLVIATPGRLCDVLDRYDDFRLGNMEALVLDEADMLLSLGFKETLEKIMGRLPRMRRTGLFSATSQKSNKELRSLARAGLRNPVLINVAVHAPRVQEELGVHTITPTTLTNYYAIVPMLQKMDFLVEFLRNHKDSKIICFFCTCTCVDFYVRALSKLFPDLQIDSLHGKMAQKRREKTFESFHSSPSKALFCTDVAARGLDVTDVDWVLQFDAPTKPESYIHRVGRSGRAGRIGNSLLLLTEKEESYVQFLRGRKVPLRSYPSVAPSLQILPQIKELVLKDRDLLEKGTRAFTSYVRAYKEHYCAFIFRFASLDLGHLATSFSLLRLPKMPELRDIHENLDFQPAPREIHIGAIPFLDKPRERARQKRLKEELKQGGKSAKHILAEKKKANLEAKRKEKRKIAVDKGRNPDKKRGKQQQIFDEWDELAKEERLVKKMKKGKISKNEFDRLMYGEAETNLKE